MLSLIKKQKTKQKKTNTFPSSIFLAAETLYMAHGMSQNVLTWAQLRDVIAVGIRKSLRHWDTYIKQPENCCSYDTFAGQCCSLWYWHSMLLFSESQRGTCSVGRWQSRRQKILWCFLIVCSKAVSHFLLACNCFFHNVLQNVINGCVSNIPTIM